MVFTIDVKKFNISFLFDEVITEKITSNNLRIESFVFFSFDFKFIFCKNLII